MTVGAGAHPARGIEGGSRTYFARLCEQFAEAEVAAGGALVRDFAIAGFRVRLGFAGSALVSRITPALAHLARPPGEAPAITVHLWDSASTGTTMPPPAWGLDDFVARGQIRGFGEGRVFAAFHHGAGALSMLDVDANVGLFWSRDATALPDYERAAPLRALLAWSMERRGRHLVHAAAVGTARGGVLIAGRGGSGKSTTALLCADAGFHYVGDDYVLLDGGPPPVVHSVYRTAKLDTDQVDRLPRLAPLVANPDRPGGDKALVFIDAGFAACVESLPLRAILLPRVTGRPRTTVRTVSPAAALIGLAPSTIFQQPGAGTTVLGSLGEFVQRLPAYALDLGTDLAEIPRVIHALLDGR
jgi:hypothetical protein